jgi:Uma2 family endonuclease
MIAVPDWPYGPYTIDDLDALPDEGLRRELVNGWITVAPWPGPRHDHAAKVLERALDRAAEAAQADVYVRGPLDLATGPAMRIPDLAVIEGRAARAARDRRARAYDAIDALVVVEIISPRGGTERADRVDKIFEYARAGIPQYWLIDLEPEPHVTVRTLGDDCRFHVTASVPAGTALTLDEPFPFSLDPEELVG